MVWLRALGDDCVRSGMITCVRRWLRALGTKNDRGGKEEFLMMAARETCEREKLVFCIVRASCFKPRSRTSESKQTRNRLSNWFYMQSLGNEEHVFVKISADAYDFYDNQMVNLTRQFLHQDRKLFLPMGWVAYLEYAASQYGNYLNVINSTDMNPGKTRRYFSICRKSFKNIIYTVEVLHGCCFKGAVSKIETKPIVRAQ